MSKKKLKRLLNRLQEQIEMTDTLNSALFDLKCLLVDEANHNVKKDWEEKVVKYYTQEKPCATTCGDFLNDDVPEKPGVFAYEPEKPKEPQLKPGDVCEVILNEGHFFEIGDYVEVIEIAKGISRNIKCVNAKGPQVRIQFLNENELKLKQ